MAIVWGPWETAPSPGGTSGMRVGLDCTWSAVSNTSTTATLTVKVYTENYLTYTGDSQVINFGGGAGAGMSDYSFSNSSGTDPVLRTTKTYVYTYGSTSYGTSPGSVSLSATMSGVFDGTTASVSVNPVVPARPYGVPTAPSSVVAVRGADDTKATLTWVRNATTAKPYTSHTVAFRSLAAKASSWSAWTVISSPSATATSLAITGLKTNTAYQFEIRANNSVGSSAYVTSGYVYMTAGAPTSVSSAVNAAGTQITTTWVNNHVLSSNYTMTVERSVNGGAYAVVASGLAGLTTTSWTDTTPGAGTNTYRVKAVSSAGSLQGPYGTGNTVATVVPPLAPTLLSPNGAAVDFSQPVILTWQHNPGADNAAQTSFYIDYSTNAGGTWTALNGAGTSSAVSSYTIPAGTLANGTTYLWRVRTRGSTLAAIGPNSASATMVGSAKPVAGITAPTATTVVLPFTATWTYSQAQGSPQAAWEANLYAADGTTLLEARAGEDTAVGVQFTYPVQDNLTYVVKVRVKSGAGLWGDWSSVTTTLDLLPPAATDLVAEYQPATGTVVLSLAPQAPVAGVTLPVDSVTVERRVDGGEWVTLYVGLWIPNDVIDPLPSTTRLTEYRVTSVSSSPSFYVNPVVPVLPPEPMAAGPDAQWVFLNYGDAFQKVLRFRSEPEVDVTTGRRKNTQAFLGRRKPVLLLGENRSREVSVKGTLVFDQIGGREDLFLWDSPPTDWEEAGQEAEVVCFRDFHGRRVFGSLSEVTAGAEFPGKGNLGFNVTEIDYDEQYGLFEDIAIYPNILDDETSDFEGGTVGEWGTTYFGAPAASTITSDATRAAEGTRSMKIVYPAAAAGVGPQLALSTDPTKEYVARIRVYVPAGVPAIRWGDVFGNTAQVQSTVNGAWQTLTVSWTGLSQVYLVPRSIGATTAGQSAWVDTVLVYTR